MSFNVFSPLFSSFFSFGFERGRGTGLGDVGMSSFFSFTFPPENNFSAEFFRPENKLSALSFALENNLSAESFLLENKLSAVLSFLSENNLSAASLAFLFSVFENLSCRGLGLGFLDLLNDSCSSSPEEITHS